MGSHDRFSIDRRTVLQGAVSLAALSIAGTASRPAFAAGGGTLTLCYSYETPALVSLASTAVYGSAKVTEGLLWLDHEMNAHPQLATEWTVSPDGLTYTFKLRENVRWHDGKDFTADDVVFSLLTLKEVHPRGRSTFGQLVSATATGPLSVVMEFNSPVPYLIKALTAWESPIVPKHLYAGTNPATNRYNNAPIGTGPFRFTEREVGSYAIFDRNEDYWDKSAPHLDRIIVKFIPEAGGRSVALESGDVDIVNRTAVELADIERLKALPHLNVTSEGYEGNQNVLTLFFNLDNPRFQDIRVRQAIAHAVNRDAVAAIIYYGLYEPFASPIGTKLKDFHDASPSPYPFDVAKAEALLDEAGLPRGTDGKRFKLVYDASPLIEQADRFAEFMRASLTKIGIDVQVRTQDVSSYTKRIYTDRDFEMSGMTFSNLIDPTVGVQRIYWSKNFKPGVPFSNGMNYKNNRVDELLEAAASEPDLEKRKTYFAEFQKIIMEEVPGIPLGAQQWLTIFNRRVADHSVSSDGIEGNLAEARIN